MIIRKLFKFEGSHIVRNCTSDRCSHSIHGHSYKVELFLTSDRLDNAGMVVDFGLLSNFKEIVDLFDHTHLLWAKDNEVYKNFIQAMNDRWIILPCNPSAELLSSMFFACFESILEKTEFNNGEGNVVVQSVRVHETDTGYAESDRNDYDRYLEMYPEEIEVSPSLAKTEIYHKLFRGIKFVNPKVELQVKL